MSDRVRRAQMLIAAVALIAGAIALLFARDVALLSARGARVGSLFSLNPLGALLTIALSAVAFASALVRRLGGALLAGAGFLVAAAIQLVQTGRATNWLGGRPSTFSFLLAAGVGLCVLAIAQRGYRQRGGDAP